MTLTTKSLATALTGALLAVGLALPLTSAAAAEEQKQAKATTGHETSDPLEGLNRATSEFNRTLREWIIDPLVDGYQAITPDPVEEAISNVVSNLTEPLTIVSSLLQGDLENAGNATKRFIVNTAAGLGGIMDVATGDGYELRQEDLGQALGAHGVDPGPHIVLPIIGPSNLRDVVGDVAVFLVNPLPLAATVAAGGVEYSDKKESIKALTDGAIDPYIVERDGYEQNRRFAINNGQQLEVPVIAEID